MQPQRFGLTHEGTYYHFTGKAGHGLRGARAGMACWEYASVDDARLWVYEDGHIELD